MSLKRKLSNWQNKLVKSQLKPMPSRLLDVAAKQLEPSLCGIFGYFALLYGEQAKKLVIDKLAIKKSIVVSQHVLLTDLCCRFDELAIASDCIDLVVLPEILRESQFPHQILREVERVLIPEGYIILLIENPWSWFSVRNRIVRFIANHKKRETRIGQSRIKDWFRLLGFEITDEIALCSGNIINKKLDFELVKSMIKISCEFFASHYVIVAKKKVSTMTPIRPSWRSNQKLVAPRLADPSVTNRVDDCVKQIVG